MNKLIKEPDNIQTLLRVMKDENISDEIRIRHIEDLLLETIVKNHYLHNTQEYEFQWAFDIYKINVSIEKLKGV